MECNIYQYDFLPLHIYTGYKSKCYGINEEEESLNTRRHKDPVFHDTTARLAMGVQICVMQINKIQNLWFIIFTLTSLVTFWRLKDVIHLCNQSVMRIWDLVKEGYIS